ncbi:hypothetical protein [Staphylococcus phage PT1-4]
MFSNNIFCHLFHLLIIYYIPIIYLFFPNVNSYY